MLFWKRKPRPSPTLIVGLGNPGSAYARNRHNVGFRCVESLARQHGISLKRRRGHARTGTGRIAGQEVLLAQPLTFMNRSGLAVGHLARRYAVPPERLIVIHDDLDLPPGKVRLRRDGSPAGHKGVISVIESLSSRDFIRVRVGIGRPDTPGEQAVIDYVLGDPSPDEEKRLEAAVRTVTEAVTCLLSEGLAAAMNRYN